MNAELHVPASDGGGKQRLDQALVAMGLMESRAQAQASIAAGLVTVDGVTAAKPGLKVSAEQDVRAQRAHPYVSRGGLKLAHGLKVFRVTPAGRTCLDVGASTGGFTDVLLRAGADHVYAVDVGRGQLHPSLRGHARVTSLESTDARSLTRAILPRAPELVVCDASFIGLEKLLETPLGLAAADAEAVLLFKPQFQVGPAHVGRGGLVSDAVAAAAARAAFDAWLAGQGWRIASDCESPITGGDGNREFLIHAIRQRA